MVTLPILSQTSPTVHHMNLYSWLAVYRRVLKISKPENVLWNVLLNNSSFHNSKNQIILFAVLHMCLGYWNYSFHFL